MQFKKTQLFNSQTLSAMVKRYFRLDFTSLVSNAIYFRKNAKHETANFYRVYASCMPVCISQTMCCLCGSDTNKAVKCNSQAHLFCIL